MTVKEFEEKYGVRYDPEMQVCYHIVSFDPEELSFFFGFGTAFHTIMIRRANYMTSELYKDILDLWEGLRNDRKGI